MQKIALVGNIASGKSEAEKILIKNGYKVLDTDVVCHELLTKISQVATAFANYEVFESGEISREKLGKIVFNNPELKKTLESIIYPHLKLHIEAFFNDNSEEKYCFVAIPLLFEAKMEDMFDKIMFIYCDDEIRLQRLMKRNNYSKEYAQLRMNVQMPQEAKAKASDFVICNNSTVEDLEAQINKVIG